MIDNELLTLKKVFAFPKITQKSEDIIAIGGDLLPGRLLSAYQRGIFPWFSDNDPIVWWSPQERFVLFPEKLHLSHSTKQLMKKNNFTVTFDTDFRSVIGSCRNVTRKNQDGTWITNDMMMAYSELHELGFAHSVEVRENDKLVGGLYGISLGGIFFGESMFSFVSGASKVGFVTLVGELVKRKFNLIDCQTYTPYLESFGAQMIPRKEFKTILTKSLKRKNFRGSWKNWLV